MFKRKKEKELEKRAERIRRERIRKVLEAVKPELRIEKYFTSAFYTSDYYQFLKEVRKEPTTLYEKLCAGAERIVKIKPDAKTKEKLENEIMTAYLNVTPEGVLSLASLSLLAFLVLSLSFLLLGFMNFGIFLLFAGILIFFYLYNYPAMLSRSIEVKMGSDVVLAILYMVIYMRTSPNLEGAIKFAAENLSGPLAWDLKKLLWDLEVGKYPSLQIALASYLTKWKDKNKDFVEAMYLLKAATGESKQRQLMLLDEAMNIILNGTREKMKHYAQMLRLPVMLVHAMGVLLPVIGLVMFPIVVIFMADIIKPIFLFIGYDIILPLFLFWYMSHILRTKPATFSQPDLSEVKGIPPIGKVKLFGRNISILPISFLISFPFITFGFVGFGKEIGIAVAHSVMIILGISLAIIIYCWLDSYRKIKVRNDIERIEDEFSEALFQLGNQIAGGRPIETAIDNARENLRNLKISDLLLHASINMKKLGMTFEQALFDREVGAIWYYPSRLIRSVFQVIIESSKKSVQVASLTMLTISRYLKGVHDVKEEISDILGETLTSMKFLAMFLAPLIAGVVVTMAIIIIQILFSLSMQISGITAQAGSVQALLLFGWSQGGKGIPIAPELFQLIVGIYMIETALLLSFFINRLEYGEDAIGLRDTIAKILFFATFIYIAAWWITFSAFAEPIKALLMPL
jgi:hypothetical protein